MFDLFWQIHIRELDCVSSLYHALTGFLQHGDENVIIYALSALSQLVVSDPMGDEVFTASNLEQTFQLVFDLLVKENSEVDAER